MIFAEFRDLSSFHDFKVLSTILLTGTCKISAKLTKIPYSAKLWQDKTLANQSFQSFGEENVGKFTLATLVTWNLIFGRV